MEIELSGQLSAGDLRRAMSLGYTRSFRFLRVVMPIFLTLPLISIVGGGIDALLGADAPPPPAAWLSLLLPAVVLLALVAGAVYLLWILPLRNVDKVLHTPLCRGTFHGLATDDTFALNNDTSASTVRWDAFVRYKMSDDVVLLYQNESAYNMVPRGFFRNDDDWARFREHVRTTVPGK